MELSPIPDSLHLKPIKPLVKEIKPTDNLTPDVLSYSKKAHSVLVNKNLWTNIDIKA